ncbi:16406_t:CDS:2 [Cetraspora pellucida]|uniref:16406_t:CDS:1 n=1 Tax=Cetraspora pellucida TaxID=1433469 RepID=A0A9N9C4V3_9GLOM|nr:16406_t:CDS:2 [Cetraspora pellucida]
MYNLQETFTGTSGTDVSWAEKTEAVYKKRKTTSQGNVTSYKELENSVADRNKEHYMESGNTDRSQGHILKTNDKTISETILIEKSVMVEEMLNNKITQNEDQNMYDRTNNETTSETMSREDIVTA